MPVTFKPSLLFFTGILSAVIIFFIVGFDEDKKTNASPATVDTLINWKVPLIPAAMDFAGEKVPLERAEIKEYFDRNFTLIYYQTGTILNLMKLSKRWFPVIEERLKLHGLPDDFKYLCVAESNLQNLTSTAGAVGFWQFMPSTAPSYNMQVNDKVDERYNVIRSTDAACRYIKESYTLFGSWTAAAAAYNCGKGGYNSHAIFQQTKDYYRLQLPEETNNYIFRILSFKFLFQHADSLGYQLPAEILYQPYRTKKVTITSSINNLAQYAINNGTTYKMLKILNPWIRGRNLTVSGGRSYEILLPVE